MRWEKLFDDLESQLEQELGAEELEVVAEEERLRLGRLTLRERVLALVRRSHEPEQVRLVLTDGEVLGVGVTSVGRDWIAGEVSDGARRRSCIVPLPAVSGMLPSADQLARSLEADPEPPMPSALSDRLGLAFVLRELCRRRAGLDVRTRSERLHGTVDRVGRDHLDLAEHEPGVPRRRAAVSRMRLVAFADILTVRF